MRPTVPSDPRHPRLSDVPASTGGRAGRGPARAARRAAAASVVAGVVLGAAPATAAAANVDQFRHGGWRGWAHIVEGEFRHCVVSGGYSNDTTLSFFYDDAGFKVAVRRPGWDLDPGGVYGVRVSINPGLSGRVPGVAARADSLLMPLSALDRPVRHMRRGYTLALEVDGFDRLTFDLTGTSVALQRLIACYGANG